MKAREFFDKKEYAKAIEVWEQDFKNNPYLESGYSGTGNLILDAASQVFGKSKLECIDYLNLPIYYKHLLRASTYYQQGNYGDAIQNYMNAFEALDFATSKELTSNINIYCLKALAWEYTGHSYSRQYLQIPTPELIDKVKQSDSKAREIAKLAGQGFYGSRCYHTANNYLSIAIHLKNNDKTEEAYLLAEEAKTFAEEALGTGDAYYYYQTLAHYYANFKKESQEKVESLRQCSLKNIKDESTKAIINDFYDKLIKTIEESKMLERQQQQIKDLEQKVEEKTKQLEALQQAFMEISSKVKTEQQFFDSVLLNAAIQGNIKKINSALDFDADIKAKNENGQTALHLAVIHQHQEIADFLITKEPSLFMTANNDGLTPIQHMAQAGQLEMLDWLYEKGKTISEFSNHQEEFNKVYTVSTSETKIFLANKRLLESAKTGKIEGVIDALSKEAIVNCKSNNGETALHKATYYEYKDIVQLLIENGADPTIRNNKQHEEIHKQHESVLDIAKTAKNQELISIVATPFLIFAANHGSQPDVLFALEAGAQLNGSDTNGQIALHRAVLAGNIDVIKLLLRKHAEGKIDIHIADKHDNTPYHLAVKTGIKVKTKTAEISLEIYLLEKFGAYKKEIKLYEKTKLSNSSHSLIASVGQIGENNLPTTSLNNVQTLVPDNSNQLEENSNRFNFGKKFG